MTEGGSLHVLLVEDSPSERWLMAEILRSRGHMVTACASASAALKEWESEHFPLLILDLTLEEGSGIEISRTIREKPGGDHPVIVVVTGKNDPDTLEQVLGSGADDYVAKPFDVAMLNVRLAVAESAVRARQERQEAQGERDRARADLQSLFRNLGEVVFTVDLAANRLVQVSPSVETMLGLSRDALIGEPERWPELFPGHTADGVRGRLEAHNEESALTIELTHGTGDGETRWFTASLHPTRDERERLVRVDGVIAEVTTQRRNQMELAARNRELRTLHDISEVALEADSTEEGFPEILEVICRDTGFPIAIVEWEQGDGAALRLVAARGVPSESLWDVPPIGLDVSLSGKAFRTKAAQVVVGVDLRSQLGHSLGGVEGTGTVLAFPIVTHGVPVGVLSLGHTDTAEPDRRMLRWGSNLANYVASFSERMRAIEALRESEEKYRSLAIALQKANHELESFGYTVSHDLRAPLRTMEGFTHTILDRFGDEIPAEARDYAQRILASGEHAETLISDLLAYSRLTLQQLDRVPVELSSAVSTALDQLSADVGDSEADIEVDGVLPRVIGDQTTLVQVLVNLISNAIKFTEKGVDPVIRIRSERAGSEVRVWVEDNGVGVPRDQVEKIFGTFERLTQTQDRQGTGIGLAIVRRGMERIGGSAGVEPGPVGGSRFWIQLPAAQG